MGSVLPGVIVRVPLDGGNTFVALTEFLSTDQEPISSTGLLGSGGGGGGATALLSHQRLCCIGG